MGWNCTACTYQNDVVDGLACEICGTKRQNDRERSQSSSSLLPSLLITATDASRKCTSRSGSRKTATVVQSTLFGGIAVVPSSKSNSNNNSNAKTRSKLQLHECDESNETTPKSRKRKEPPPAYPSALGSGEGAVGVVALSRDCNINNNKQPKDNRSCQTSKKDAGMDASRAADAPILSAQRIMAGHTNGGSSNGLSRCSYAELKTIAERVLRDVFQLQSLRNLQPKAIKAALKRQSCLVVMATGGGKSLCFQLPAVTFATAGIGHIVNRRSSSSTALVISPLIALMQDQVQALHQKGIAAAVLSSANGERQNAEILGRLIGRKLSSSSSSKSTSNKEKSQHLLMIPEPWALLYCTPEQIQSTRFRNILSEMYQRNPDSLSLFAIDEAHCLSSWGHDFRPAYRELGWLRTTFPDVPCMACTATATPRVIQDIQATLHLKNATCLLGSFDRPNITYRVRYKDALDQATTRGALGDLMDFIQRQHQRAAKSGVPCAGIVYVHTRKETTEIADQIRSETGIVAQAYHGSMKDIDRCHVQQSWMSGATPVAVATVAFGMGIDLGHVRYVAHWTLPKSIESFYQESGRAGRDQLPSISVLYYSLRDAEKMRYLANLPAKSSKKGGVTQGRPAASINASESIEQMIEYCTKPACRRAYLLKHFGESQNRSAAQICGQTCDYCCDPQGVEQSIQAAIAAADVRFQTRLSAHVYTGGKLGTKTAGMDAFNYGGERDDDSVLDDDDDIPWDAGDLQITRRTDWDDEIKSDHANEKCMSTTSFAKASSILAKYEAVECQQKQKNGFVRFKEKDHREEATSSRGVIIPDHLRTALLKPVKDDAKQGNLAAAEKKTSKDFAAEADRLRMEIAAAKAERDAQMKALQAKIASRKIQL